MQFSKILQPLRNEAFRLFNDPRFVKTYVDTGVTALGYALIPLSAFMEHLLTVQGIDPNFDSDKVFQEALTSAISQKHDDEYDSDYDVSWVHKKFHETRNKLGKLQLTQQKFRDLTDVSRIDIEIGSPFLSSDQTEVNQVAPESEKREIPVFGSDQKPKNLEDLLSALLPKVENRLDQIIDVVGNKTQFSPDIDLKAMELTKALDKLVEYSKETKKAEPAKKHGVKTTKKKLNKKPQKIVRRS